LRWAEAKQRARGAGREDIGRYLDLRTKNDLLRRTAINWLTATFTSLAGEANRAEQGYDRETGGAQFFPRLVDDGRESLTLRRGVRTLRSKAAGRESRRWIRARRRPGLRQHQHLAAARDAELILAPKTNGSPQWLTIERARPGHPH